MKFTPKCLLIFICLIFSNCQQTEKGTNSFTLQGEIKDQKTGKIVLQYGFLSTFHQDTVEIINGKFSLKE